MPWNKAVWAGLIGFLSPIGYYLASTDEWSWRAFAATVVSGLVAGIGTYVVPNRAPTHVGQHEAVR